MPTQTALTSATHDGAFAATMQEAMPASLMTRSKVMDMEQALSLIAEADEMILAQRRRIAYLETLSLSDEVTGLMNRRGFMSALHRELSQAKREPQANGVLIIFDLDNFKQINDTHGHAAGDAYLAAFAAALAAEVRPSDVVARLGGDEFAVLLTRAAAKPGMARAATIVRNLNGKSMTWRNSVLPLRASAGVATYTGRDIAEAVMVSADLRLYANKQKRKAGR